MVSAAKIQQTLDETVEKVEVISSQDIATSGAKTLSEAVKQLPGVTVTGAAVTAAATLQSVPKAAPPCLTFGQLMFSSTMSTADGSMSAASSAHSSTVAPAMFAITRISFVSRFGSS